MAFRGCGYSSFEHLVSALFLRPETLMLIVTSDPLTLYCDASKSRSQHLTVVAGAISSVAKWREFDVKWSEILKDNGLEYFHMKEFAHSTDQFAHGWKKNEGRRRRLIQELTSKRE
jgi:hypothetical protein